MPAKDVNIVHRLSAYGPNVDYHRPRPVGWASMDKGAREAWARQKLRHFNAQAIFVRVY